ncbi:uncharacterized protein LOC101848943 [Aplysia californica]|uniref:Uncharacterized protein LOC101848943 n=1 Tax=Aplysia californica TaxID=6500 RepID=A0ABM1AG08_APLCA|nr:uncharacterized protein LOC101848943 [Aplysia californica]
MAEESSGAGYIPVPIILEPLDDPDNTDDLHPAVTPEHGCGVSSRRSSRGGASYIAVPGGEDEVDVNRGVSPAPGHHPHHTLDSNVDETTPLRLSARDSGATPHDLQKHSPAPPGGGGGGGSDKEKSKQEEKDTGDDPEHSEQQQQQQQQ